MNLRTMRDNQQDMSRYVVRGAQILVDLAVLSFAYALSFFIRFEFAPPFEEIKIFFFTWPYVVVFQFLVLALFGVPSFSWRYIGMREAQRILLAVGAACLVLFGIRLGLGPYYRTYAKFVIIPLSVIAMDGFLAFLGVAGVRVLRRSMAERAERRLRGRAAGEEKRTLLIGAGSAGVLVAKEVQQNPHLGIRVVGFVDDNPTKIGTIIQGHTVLGDTASIPLLGRKHRVEQAVISIASARGADIRRIAAICEKAALPVRIIPGIYDILDGKVNLSRIREVTIEDLLGRAAVELDMQLIGRFLSGKRVLVTGAGGSIGSELCRQVCRFGPEKIVLVEQAENALFHIHKELAEQGAACPVVPCVADVCDSRRVEQLFAEHRPAVVFHAAAHKHVPMMEWNPGEAIKNNVFGTKKMADAADRHGAEAFVLISTDKAVNPSSIMGASKRVAEIYTQSLAARSRTKFVAVRFGNVLGSAGSVIPIFKEQIERGGPVTVTHPEMKRYFMTIPEACQLVMQAAAMGEGSEIFVLDMGEPVRIIDLARDLIRLSGFGEQEIPIQLTGIRPGEKLFEELSTAAEEMDKTRHPKIFIGRITRAGEEEVARGLEALAGVTDSTSKETVRAALALAVPEMRLPDHDPLPETDSGQSPVPPSRPITIH